MPVRSRPVTLAAAVVAALAILVMSGCSDKSDPATESTPSGGSSSIPAATSPAPILYVAPPDLCAVVDLSALTEIYPTLGKPDSYTSPNKRSQFCTRALLSSDTTVTFTLHADYAPSTRGVAESFAQSRQLTDSTEQLTDVSELGSGAFWFADGNRAYLELYDANLSVNIRVNPVSSRHKLPSDSGPRLVRLAQATLAALRAARG